MYLHINHGGSPQSSKLFKMMEVKAYVFSHPAYGRLRVVKTEEGIFYNLEDVMCLYEKSGHETFEVIADSEGQIAGFEMNLAPEEKGELNFITDRELGYVGKRKTNVHTIQYFIDEVMLHDLETNLTTELKLVRKWIHGFVEKVLAKYDLAELNRGKGLLGIERIPELQEPLDIAYNDYGLWINSQYLTL